MISVSDSASEDETAAIIAAVNRLLLEQDEPSHADTGLVEQQWEFTARIESVEHMTVRASKHIPSNYWTAAGRVDRMSRL